ncbi:hypothetical protein [Schleiferilactobacillus harbinensis]|uniref:Uncharacterized protein n=1 Tax=Schleiferilactobacillus harbinensis TaxID=304207 RepID=A0A5P8M953_9LACO|nr:hypothetical protein [Schleiferilactobacillus harbinensis]QFR25056.1 hypothetical protein D1010_17620 [Schleiferilactobacillus harbinensis]
MKNEYSPLVKQAWRQLKNQGYNISMDKLFRLLFSDGEIDENGEPTQAAFDNGYVESVPINSPEGRHELLAQFKDANPLYRDIDDSHFLVTEDGTLGIDEFGQRIVANRIANDPNYLKTSRDSARLLLHLLDSEKREEDQRNDHD